MEKSREKSTQPKPLVLYAHSNGFDRLYQMAAIALTAAVSGRPVVVVLFFWALRAVVKGEMDELVFTSTNPAAAETARRKISTTNSPPPSQMFSMARETGRVKVFACSASMQYMGLELEETKRVVDEVVGLSTILRLAADSPDSIYL